MFTKCSSLTNITLLENRDVSNGIGFTFMFSEYSFLSDIKPIQKWNVENGEEFGSIFKDCSSLQNSEIKELFKKIEIIK